MESEQKACGRLIFKCWDDDVISWSIIIEIDVFLMPAHQHIHIK